MRVVTPCGLGNTDEDVDFTGILEVKLDESFAGQEVHELQAGTEVFPFTEWAVVRVLNVSGVGYISNFQFQESPINHSFPWTFPVLPDEVTFFLELTTGKLIVNQELGLLAQDFMMIRPWVDRWGRERAEVFKTREEAIAGFRKELKEVAGSAGLSSAILIDVQNEKLLSFALFAMTVHGPIYMKLYE